MGPPLVYTSAYARSRRPYAFRIKISGKHEGGPSRRTVAEAVADRDKILKLRDRGASDAEAGPPRSGGGSG